MQHYGMGGPAISTHEAVMRLLHKRQDLEPHTIKTNFDILDEYHPLMTPCFMQSVKTGY
jgi:hypothetical protein